MMTTLRRLNRLDDTPAALADATVILIDYQNTYTQGVMELDGWEAALDAGARLLERARAAGATVIHVVHDGGEGTPYDIRAEIGRIHSRVAPGASEAVVVKKVPDAFVDTELAELVDTAGRGDLVIAGFMTHMCVAFTAQGAFLRGLRPPWWPTRAPRVPSRSSVPPCRRSRPMPLRWARSPTCSAWWSRPSMT